MPLLTEAQAEAFVAERHWGVLATIRSNGRPQLSNVGYALLDGALRVSVTSDRAKTAPLRRDPRASMPVSSDDFWTYVVVEGTASLSPVAEVPGDATCRALLALYEAIRSEPHPDEAEFFDAMVAESRLELAITPERLYPVQT